MKTFALIAVTLLGGVLLVGAMQFPKVGSPTSPPATHVSPYYIEHSLEDTNTPNVVTSVLADYRGYDTMFETAVVFSAALACFFLLRVYRIQAPDYRLYRHIPTGITLRVGKGGTIARTTKEFEEIDSTWIPHDIIIKTTVRLTIPFIQIFALYVVAHGHHSPGGGFQGGVILGASIILLSLSQNLRVALSRFGERITQRYLTAGILLYALVGGACILLGENFLSYSALADILGTTPAQARSYGILLVEIGVAMTVMAAMIWIYYHLSSVGRMDEGL